jgi:threonine/homoserine/homoserine lactone efflux protein
MIALLPDGVRGGAFVLASLLLAVTPGPGVLYIVTRTLAQGRAAGLASVAGVALGNLGNAAGASIGLAALLSVSGAAFTAVQWAGGAWLLWLGVQVLRQPRAGKATGAALGAVDRRRIFRDGLLVALLNPKTALFFAAFLPPFLDPGGSAMAQSLALSAVFVLLAAGTDSAYVLLATAVAPALLAGPRWSDCGRWLSAAVCLGLGLWTLAR